ncbi:MAG: hypothetical protein WC222_07820 [Parachlamydiales bacterium]|jgi:hypothetical protein
MEDKDLNIFRSAAEKSRPKKLSTPGFNHKTPPAAVYSNPENEKVLIELQQKRIQLKSTYEQIAKGMGMTPEQLNDWLDKNSILAPGEQEIMQQLVGNLKQQIARTSVNPKKLRKSEGEVQKDTQNRKSKTLGSRKKWIPM